MSVKRAVLELTEKTRVTRAVKNFIRSMLISSASFISPELGSKIIFKMSMKRKLNLKNPVSFNEKLMKLKLEKYWYNPLVTQCADKYAVREYVKDKGCQYILNKLVGVYERIDDIDWNILPSKFVIKLNYASGWNLICYEKSNFDIADAKRILRGWMKKKYGLQNVEQGIYGKIKKKIVIEEFIESEDGDSPHDFKFFCSYGEVKFIYTSSGHDKYIDYYLPDWTYWDGASRIGHFNYGKIDKPDGLDEMMHIAELLSVEFPFVRVDLYYENSRVYFGELTFTPAGCCGRFDPYETDIEMGKMFESI